MFEILSKLKPDRFVSQRNDPAPESILIEVASADCPDGRVVVSQRLKPFCCKMFEVQFAIDNNIPLKPFTTDESVMQVSDRVESEVSRNQSKFVKSKEDN